MFGLFFPRLVYLHSYATHAKQRLPFLTFSLTVTSLEALGLAVLLEVLLREHVPPVLQRLADHLRMDGGMTHSGRTDARSSIHVSAPTHPPTGEMLKSSYARPFRAIMLQSWLRKRLSSIPSWSRQGRFDQCPSPISHSMNSFHVCHAPLGPHERVGAADLAGVVLAAAALEEAAVPCGCVWRTWVVGPCSGRESSWERPRKDGWRNSHAHWNQP